MIKRMISFLFTVIIGVSLVVGNTVQAKADDSRKIYQIAISNASEESTKEISSLIVDDVVYSKIEDIAKITGFEIKKNTNDTGYILIRDYKIVQVDTADMVIKYGNNIKKVVLIFYENATWCPLSDFLLYLNARGEWDKKSNTIRIRTASITMDELFSQTDTIWKQGHLYNWMKAANESKNYFQASFMATIFDILGNGDMISAVTGNYYTDIYKETWMNIFGICKPETSNKSVEYIGNIEDIYNNLDEDYDIINDPEISKFLAWYEIGKSTEEGLNILESVKKIRSITDENFNRFNNVVINNPCLNDKDKKGDEYKAAIQLYNIYLDNPPFDELLKYVVGTLSSLSEKTSVSDSFIAIADIVWDFDYFGRMPSATKVGSKLKKQEALFCIQSTMNSSREQVKRKLKTEGFDKQSIQFYYDSLLLYLQSDMYGTILGGEYNPIFKEKYLEYSNISMDDLFLDDLSYMSENKIDYKGIEAYYSYDDEEKIYLESGCTLSGNISKLYFGSEWYHSGETQTAYILSLSKPVSFYDEYGKLYLEHVSEIQLCENDQYDLESLDGKSIKITGIPFMALTSSYIRDIGFLIDTINVNETSNYNVYNNYTGTYKYIYDYDSSGQYYNNGESDYIEVNDIGNGTIKATYFGAEVGNELSEKPGIEMTYIMDQYGAYNCSYDFPFPVSIYFDGDLLCIDEGGDGIWVYQNVSKE